MGGRRLLQSRVHLSPTLAVAAVVALFRQVLEVLAVEVLPDPLLDRLAPTGPRIAAVAVAVALLTEYLDSTAVLAGLVWSSSPRQTLQPQPLEHRP